MSKWSMNESIFIHLPAHWPFFLVTCCVQVQPKESITGLWNGALQARGEPAVLHAIFQNRFLRVERGRCKYPQQLVKFVIWIGRLWILKYLYLFPSSWTLTLTEECFPWSSKLWLMKETVGNKQDHIDRPKDLHFTETACTNVKHTFMTWGNKVT